MSSRSFPGLGMQAQLLANIGGHAAGPGTLAAAPKGFRPTGFPGRLPHTSSLPRVIEEGDAAYLRGGDASQRPQLTTPPPQQRVQRVLTPLTGPGNMSEASPASCGPSAADMTPPGLILPPKLFLPPQPLLPGGNFSGSPRLAGGGNLRPALCKSETADSTTLQVGILSLSRAAGKIGFWLICLAQPNSGRTSSLIYLLALCLEQLQFLSLVMILSNYCCSLPVL